MKVTGFIIMFAIFCVGLWLMALAFEVQTMQAEYFLGGILVVSLAFGIPAHILSRTE